MKLTKPALVASSSALILSLTPLPFVIDYPGPTHNTLGNIGDTPLITISGHDTQPTNGQLDLVTIKERGGPGSYVNAFDVIAGWISPQWSVFPSGQKYQSNISYDDAKKQALEAMSSSQDQAFAAALTNLKIPYTQDVVVQTVQEASPAEGKLQVGDIVKKVGDTSVTSLHQFRLLLAAYPPGVSVPVVVSRQGHDTTVDIVPQQLPQTYPVIGILATTKFHFPFEAKIQIENVGGPSAGMMFALGIIDKIGTENLTQGKNIAGTGAITQDGFIVPINGVKQKMISAKDAGVGLFLVPAGNCSEVIDNIPEGLKVVKVSTLEEAKTAALTYAKGNDVSSLPVCTPES